MNKKNISLPQFESDADALLIRAPAKINLSLLIADKRPDGFHNLETLMAKINLYDEILFEPAKAEGIELICDGLWSPPGKDNLVFKAAEFFYQTISKKPAIKIKLTKKIPAGSGLGGASSDAASVLLALNKLHDEILSIGKLYEISALLGSDVSFFLNGPLALCTGRGEKVEKIDKPYHFSALLILPDISMPTKRVYGNFKVDLELFNSLSSQIRKHIYSGKIDLIQKMCANMLAKTCFVLDNELALLQVKIQEITKLPVCLSGSGSAMFVFLPDINCQNKVFFQRQICSLGCNCIIVFDNEW